MSSNGNGSIIPGMDPLAALLGESPVIVAVREQIRRLLQRQADARRLPPILIHGETGTGKGLLARAIHRAGPRASGPFVDVNCAAIPETLLEAELFGFERGAFTDARQAKAGLFQAAHRGTVFLDEIGLLTEGLQGKLLTVIEERTVRRLGSTRSEPVDVWILAATSADLNAAARARVFREDLYHRLAVLTLSLPPLRERREDILLLAEHFLARACADYNLPPKRLAPDAGAALQAYHWPGNIRELSNVMERVALLSDAPLVTEETLGLPGAPAAEPREPDKTGEGLSLRDAVGNAEREHLVEALRQTNWNISRTAVLLGVSRNTLRYRIEKYGLRPGSPRPARRRVERPPAQDPADPAAVPATVPAPSIRWEPRRLTLLRATLAPPEEAKSALESSRQLEVLMEKVQSFGGRVEELSPTGIVAAFGLEPVEDAPSRAALAAMAIQKALEHARRDAAEKVTIKAGIHTSQFLVGRISGTAEIDLNAKREASAILEELVVRADPDAILVSEAASAFLNRRFDLEMVGVLERAPGHAFRLAGRERTGFGRRHGKFVGRRYELELLRNRLASAVRGHGQVVGIVGEAGIGKSRLLFEFRESLAGEQVTYLEGHCGSYGTAIPYLPVVEMLRSNCRLAETDSPEAIADKVRRSLEKIGMDAAEAAPYLLGLLGLKQGAERLAGLTPAAIQSRTFEILREMSFHGSRRRPLILAVEDLHWIDNASEAYFASLVESLAGAPLLLLVTYRSGYRPPWIEKSYATQIALQPLSPEDSLTVIHSVLQPAQVPDPLARLILTKAEGNPFFLEEMARAVVEQEDLRRPLAVPDTIHEVLLARVERLPDESKRLLQTASVLGREVSLRLLEALWEGPGGLESPLAELTRLEFLYEKRGVEEPVYVFKHPLTQEVAYGSLLSPQRQALHAAAGRALEALYAGRLDEASDHLAYHYSRAEEIDKAVEYLTRFAEKAARRYAHVEAASALEEALGHVERLPAPERDRRFLELTLRKAHSLYFLGRVRETLELLLGQETRLEGLQDPALAGAYQFQLGFTYNVLGDHVRAAERVERAIEYANRCGDRATLGKAYYVLAFGRASLGQFSAGVEYGRQAVAHLEGTGEGWWLGMAHWVVGLSSALLGDFDAALAATARASAIGDAIGDPRLLSFAAWTTGTIHATRGEWDTGIDACRRAIEQSPDPVNTAYASAFLGYAYLERGDAASAVPLLEQSVRLLSQFGFKQVQGWFTGLLGEAYLLNGRLDTARDLALRGLEITQEIKYSFGIGWIQRTLGRIARASGVLPEAETRLTEALRTFASVNAAFEVGRTRLALAEVAAARGDRDASAGHLAEALRIFRAARAPRYEERARQLANDLNLVLPDGSAAGR